MFSMQVLSFIINNFIMQLRASNIPPSKTLCIASVILINIQAVFLKERSLFLAQTVNDIGNKNYLLKLHTVIIIITFKIMLKLRKKYSAKKQEKVYYYIQLNGMNYGIFFQIYDGQNTYLIEKIMEN